MDIGNHNVDKGNCDSYETVMKFVNKHPVELFINKDGKMTDFTEEWIRLNNFKHAMQNEVGHFTDTDLDKRIIDRQLPPFVENSYTKKTQILNPGCGQGY